VENGNWEMGIENGKKMGNDEWGNGEWELGIGK